MPGPARNAPCPCGSGRKFKRCCGSDDASSQQDPEGSHLVQALARSEELARGLSLDFGVDPFDQVVLLLVELMTADLPRSLVDAAVIRGLRLHSRPALRRQAARLLRRKHRKMRGTRRQAMEFVCAALEGYGLPPETIGAYEALYRMHLKRLIDRHLDILDAEQADPELAERLGALAAEGRLEEVAALLQGRDDVLLQVERLLQAAPQNLDQPGLQALLAVLEGHPGARAVGQLIALLGTAQDVSRLEQISASLQAMSRHAWPCLLTLLDNPLLDADERFPLYAPLVSGRCYEVLERIVTAFGQPEPHPAQEANERYFTGLATLLQALDDRRAIGMLLGMRLSTAALTGLERAWGDGPWWEQWEADRAALRAGEALLQPLVRQASASEVEGAPQVTRWLPQPEPNDADPRRYYERLDWLRPADLPRSAREQEIAAAFADWIGRRLPKGEAAFEKAELAWMWTPQERWDGLPPAVALVRERTRFGGGYCARLRQNTVTEWLVLAQRLARKQPGKARRVLQGLLQLAPEEPLAQTMLAEL